MGFGERLYQLRKEKGLSQETLADAVEVSRQAVSRWENNQGYPETEKLLQLGNLLGVSVDFLLKDEGAGGQEGQTARGYYASREVAEGYLRAERVKIKTIAAAVTLFILCPVPYMLVVHDDVFGGLVALACIFVGVALLISLSFKRDTYKRLRNEPLCFDSAYFTQLSAEHEHLRPRLRWLTIGGIGLILLGLVSSTMILELLPTNVSDRWSGLFLVFLAAAVWCFIFSSKLAFAYHLLTDNEAYLARHRGNNWIWGLTMGVAACVFVVAIMMWKFSAFYESDYGGNMASVLVFIFPLVALLTWGYQRAKRKK